MKYVQQIAFAIAIAVCCATPTLVQHSHSGRTAEALLLAWTMACFMTKH
jgi:hypothetical protein